MFPRDAPSTIQQHHLLISSSQPRTDVGLLARTERTDSPLRHPRHGVMVSNSTLSADEWPAVASTPPPPARRLGLDMIKLPPSGAKARSRNLGIVPFWSAVAGPMGRRRRIHHRWVRHC